jgi:transglutaminase-like putative cysteine protease
MIKNIIILLVSITFLLSNLLAENYLLNGGQQSRIKYVLVQQIEPTPQTVTVDLTYVIPQSFQSPTFNQEISELKFTFTLDPAKKDETVDPYGNKIVKYSWLNPRTSFQAGVEFLTNNEVSFKKLETTAPFPLINLNADFNKYLSGSEQVPVDNSEIKARAAELVKNSKTEFEAVQNILSWVIDHMQYVLTPPEYDALYSLHSGKGNCQNYSHLAAALMRASGIPARIVNGITLKEPYDIRVGNQILTLNMAQGRHSWIEVYFPDLGWMPFDPQQSELFVSNRFIRVEIGLDNKSTINDGLVRWTREKGSQASLSFEENIEADFLSDQVTIDGQREEFGPRKLLLAPPVAASFVPVTVAKVEKPVQIDQAQLTLLNYSREYKYGNTEFPEGVNFAFNRVEKESDGGKTQELQKNFLVETAEYVTSKLQYCQTFILDKPVKLQAIGLALQKFGGTGQLWVELREDQNGAPGPVAARSAGVDLNKFSSKPGYFWVDFDFAAQQLILTPDRYWISIAYSGSPIVNWFYSYGKPVGPIDGTRYKEPTETSWSKSLGYEFNYRVAGLTTP